VAVSAMSLVSWPSQQRRPSLGPQVVRWGIYTNEVPSVIKKPAKNFCYQDRFACLSIVRCPLSAVRHSSKWLVGPRGTSNRAASFFFFHLAIQGAATEFRCAGQVHRTTDARAIGCHSFVRRVVIYRATRDSRKCWRAANTEAFALYVIVAGCGRASKIFPKRARKRARSRLVRII
jgi:hypothetical protein